MCLLRGPLISGEFCAWTPHVGTSEQTRTPPITVILSSVRKMYPDFAVFFCVITFWSVGTHPAAVPVPFQQRNAQPESFWRSPCGAIVIDPPQAPNWPKLKNLLNQISMRAEMTGSEAEQRKNQFVSILFTVSIFPSVKISVYGFRNRGA